MYKKVSMKEKESNLEKAAGSLTASTLMTVISACSGMPVSSLLSPLTDSLAGDRYKERIKKEIKIINTELEKHKDMIKNLSDAQYKLINETTLTIFQTVDENKLEYLRNTIFNCLHRSDITHTDSYILSRIIRDISVDELRYILSKGFCDLTFSSLDGTNAIDPESEEGELVTGLISLGLIVPKGSTIDEIGIYIFSPIVVDLLDLVKNKN